MRTIDQRACCAYERCRQRRQKQCEEQLVRAAPNCPTPTTVTIKTTTTAMTLFTAS